MLPFQLSGSASKASNASAFPQVPGDRPPVHEGAAGAGRMRLGAVPPVVHVRGAYLHACMHRCFEGQAGSAECRRGLVSVFLL